MPFRTLVAVVFAGTFVTGVVSGEVRGIVSGYVIDSRMGSIRAVLGLPGATRLGDNLATNVRIVEGTVRNGRAVVISDEQPARVYMVRNLSAPAPEVIALSSSIPQANRVFMNASGTVALLYSAESRQFQFVRNLDSAPRYSHPQHASVLNGTFSAVAVEDSSTCALLASVDESNSYIQKVCGNIAGTVTTVAVLPRARISSIAWFHHDSDAVVADQAGDQVLLLPNVAQYAGQPVVLAGSAEGIHAPAALLALDDNTIAAINAGSPTLLVIDARTGGAIREVGLTDVPTRLELLDAPGVVACTQIGSGPLLLVDTRQNFASFFVPMN